MLKKKRYNPAARETALAAATRDWHGVSMGPGPAVIPSKLYRTGLGVCLLLLVLGAILQTMAGVAFPERQTTSAWGLDDAYISYRYAENLAQAKGLVFNRGERVEGYSNLLYVLAVAPAFWLTDRDGVYFFSVLLNVVCACAALVIFSGYVRRRLGNGAALAASVLFALCLPLWAAVAGGLETSLQLLLAIGIWVWAERVVDAPTRGEAVTLGILSALSVLTRVDGFLIPALAILYLLLKRKARAAAIGALALAATVGGLELWRYAYYGALLPTSYYVKVAGLLRLRLLHARDEFGRIILLEALWPYVLVLAWQAGQWVVASIRRRGEALAQLRFETLFAPLWVAYWFYVGGDHFWDRFLLILYPMGIFALLVAARNLHGRKAIAGLAILAVVQAGTPWRADARFVYDFNKFDCWVATGKFLGQRYPGSTLAVGALGKMPFFSGLYAVDILGLADPVVAHMPAQPGGFEPGHVKFDPDYTLARRPDLIALHIFPSQDLGFGITRAKYEPAGYQLQYLVDTRRPPHPGPHILEVSSLDDKTIANLIASGFEYGIVVKNRQP